MIPPVGIDTPDVVHRFRSQPCFFRPHDELAEERDDQPARISGRSTLTQVLVVFDPLRLIVGALLQRRLGCRRQFWRDTARRRMPSTARTSRAAEQRPASGVRRPAPPSSARRTAPVPYDIWCPSRASAGTRRGVASDASPARRRRLPLQRRATRTSQDEQTSLP